MQKRIIYHFTEISHKALKQDVINRLTKLTDKNEKICKGAVPDIFSCWSTLDMTNNKSITI